MERVTPDEYAVAISVRSQNSAIGELRVAFSTPKLLTPPDTLKSGENKARLRAGLFASVQNGRRRAM